MDIHKPKPIRHWREFLSEIGIIVIGVLIALGAEQAAESLHWAHQVSEQRAALKDELGTNAVFFYERVAVSGCLSARINALSSALAKPGATWKAQGARTYATPWRAFPSQTWQNALVSGAASHMDTSEVLAYGRIFSNVADLHQMNIQEELAAEQLSDLDHDITLTDAARERYLKALDELKFYSNGAALIAQESLGWIAAMHLMPPANEFSDNLRAARQHFGACVKTPVL
jgi:hypothetical protein